MLLTNKRFAPFFVAQALGAFNNNLFKNLLVLLLTYKVTDYESGLSPVEVANLAAGLFVAPFALFSGLGGHLADHYSKAALIKGLKGLELIIMIIASIGLMTHNVYLLFACVFLIGAQAAFFGPVKYAYMPAVLAEQELMEGNALVETATFVMILLGTLGAGLLMVWFDQAHPLAIALCAVSALGLLASLRIPECPVLTHSPIHWHTLFSSNKVAFAHARENKAIWLSVLGISWFWFLGALVLAQLPELAKNTLILDESGLTWLLALFSLGVGAGSMLSERWSGSKVEIGLVPLGSIGLTIFLVLAFFQLPQNTGALPDVPQTATPFLDNPAALGFGIYLALTGVFGGLYIVPLYALIQNRANPAHVASVVSANNVMNAVFMVGSAFVGLGFGMLGIANTWLILCAALTNLLVAIYIYGLLPEFLWRFVVWLLVHTVYRFKVQGKTHIPETGPCIVVCNHVGYSDAVVLAAAIRRPLRFIMQKPFR
jgi:MFS family permease